MLFAKLLVFSLIWYAGLVVQISKSSPIATEKRSPYTFNDDGNLDRAELVRKASLNYGGHVLSATAKDGAIFITKKRPSTRWLSHDSGLDLDTDNTRDDRIRVKKVHDRCYFITTGIRADCQSIERVIRTYSSRYTENFGVDIPCSFLHKKLVEFLTSFVTLQKNDDGEARSPAYIRPMAVNIIFIELCSDKIPAISLLSCSGETLQGEIISTLQLLCTKDRAKLSAVDETDEDFDRLLLKIYSHLTKLKCCELSCEEIKTIISDQLNISSPLVDISILLNR